MSYISCIVTYLTFVENTNVHKSLDQNTEKSPTIMETAGSDE